MDLDELQSVRDRERQTDKLQQLRESFYTDAGRFVDQLRSERDRVAARNDDPYAPEATRLNDEIEAATQLVEDIYERRIGKLVKAASFDAAGLPAQADGMTAEEQDLFDALVDDIEHHRERVLDIVEEGPPGTPGDDDGAQPERASAADGAPGSETSVADVMGAPDTDETAPAPAERDPEPRSPETRPSDPATGPGEATTGSSEVETGRGRDVPDVEPHDGDTDRDSGNGTASSAQGGPGRSSDRPDGPTGETPPVRGDGSSAGGDRLADGTDSRDAVAGRADGGSDRRVQRERVLVTEDVETFVGFDDRDYDLAADDVVTLPATNADILVERDAARRL